MRIYLLAILGGLALAPVGAVLLTVGYAVLTLQMPEDGGRRGLLAGCFGTLAGSALGCYVGFGLAWWLAGGVGGGLLGFLAGWSMAIR